mmetsp:Transcript_29048/g.65832  ORF Transcript_29048/g.65832 Transcript_29048/m.65832 type:complete len:104 (-) Transcript_29048:2-313(-)
MGQRKLTGLEANGMAGAPSHAMPRPSEPTQVVTRRKKRRFGCLASPLYFMSAEGAQLVELLLCMSLLELVPLSNQHRPASRRVTRFILIKYSASCWSTKSVRP